MKVEVPSIPLSFPFPLPISSLMATGTNATPASSPTFFSACKLQNSLFQGKCCHLLHVSKDGRPRIEAVPKAFCLFANSEFPKFTCFSFGRSNLPGNDTRMPIWAKEMCVKSPENGEMLDDKACIHPLLYICTHPSLTCTFPFPSCSWHLCTAGGFSSSCQMYWGNETFCVCKISCTFTVHRCVQ